MNVYIYLLVSILKLKSNMYATFCIIAVYINIHVYTHIYVYLHIHICMYVALPLPIKSKLSCVFVLLF